MRRQHITQEQQGGRTFHLPPHLTAPFSLLERCHTSQELNSNEFSWVLQAALNCHPPLS